MSADQAGFAAAILDPDRETPSGLTDPAGRPAGSRFSVYRNNVAVSLTEALESAFPVLRKLLGDEFFAAMAGIYLRRHPPETPLMMFFGKGMPEFLATFPPVSHLGYLPDIARLELAMRASYHAADTAPVDPAALQAMTPQRLMAVRFEFAPSAILVRSDWPIHDIWKQNMRDGPAPDANAQTVVITRAEFDPEPHALTQAQAAFLTALMDGKALGAALDAAGDGLDLTATLGLLLAGNAIARIVAGEPE